MPARDIPRLPRKGALIFCPTQHLQDPGFEYIFVRKCNIPFFAARCLRDASKTRPKMGVIGARCKRVGSKTQLISKLEKKAQQDSRINKNAWSERAPFNWTNRPMIRSTQSIQQIRYNHSKSDGVNGFFVLSPML